MNSASTEWTGAAPNLDSLKASSVARILCVEDDEELRNIYREILLQQGYEVTTASDGVHAWKTLVSGKKFDLLLTDIEMPNLGGMELVGMARLGGMKFPIILVSGYPETISADLYDRFEIAATLQKPFSSETLIDRVHQVIRG